MTNKTLSQEFCSIAKIGSYIDRSDDNINVYVFKTKKELIRHLVNMYGMSVTDEFIRNKVNNSYQAPDLENNNDNFVRLLEIKYKDEVGKKHYAVDYLQNHIDLNTKALIIHQIIELYKPDNISMFDLSDYDRQILYRIKQALQSENWSY